MLGSPAVSCFLLLHMSKWPALRRESSHQLWLCLLFWQAKCYARYVQNILTDGWLQKLFSPGGCLRSQFVQVLVDLALVSATWQGCYSTVEC